MNATPHGWMSGWMDRFPIPKNWYLVSLTIRSYTFLCLLCLLPCLLPTSVILYQVKILMFYNVRTTSLTFVGKKTRCREKHF